MLKAIAISGYLILEGVCRGVHEISSFAIIHVKEEKQK